MSILEAGDVNDNLFNFAAFQSPEKHCVSPDIERGQVLQRSTWNFGVFD
jgi:hypothetical protein